MKSRNLQIAVAVAVLGGMPTLFAAGDFALCEKVLSSTESATAPLDLSPIWDRTDLSPVDVAYSAVGWDKEPSGQGRTVTLSLVPAEGGTPITIASALVGRDTYSWVPQNLQRTTYYVNHRVFDGTKLVGSETLRAVFSFENCVMSASEEEVRSAVLGITQKCVVSNDETNPWQPIDGAGSGVESVQDVASAFSFRVEGAGTLSYEWALDSGRAEVQVDGATVGTLGPTDGWVSDSLELTGDGEHVVCFAVGTDASGMKLRNVRWLTSDAVLSAVSSGDVRMDLREGVRELADRSELLPFAYSETNFVGLAGGVTGSAVEVSVVQLTGDEDDLSLWVEKPGTRRVLYQGPGEAVVTWAGKVGVWKATYEIVGSNAKTVHSEFAVFDMRKCARGLVIFIQ